MTHDIALALIGVGSVFGVGFIVGTLWASRRIGELETYLANVIFERDVLRRNIQNYRDQLPKRDAKGRFIKD